MTAALQTDRTSRRVISWPRASAIPTPAWSSRPLWQSFVRFYAKRTSRVIAAGLLVGIAAALIAGRSMNALLFGVTLQDASTYAGACAPLPAAAAPGAYRPIRLATAVDPIVALRVP